MSTSYASCSVFSVLGYRTQGRLQLDSTHVLLLRLLYGHISRHSHPNRQVLHIVMHILRTKSSDDSQTKWEVQIRSLMPVRSKHYSVKDNVHTSVYGGGEIAPRATSRSWISFHAHPSLLVPVFYCPSLTTLFDMTGVNQVCSRLFFVFGVSC